jgi:serine/threonine-protein kinase
MQAALSAAAVEGPWLAQGLGAAPTASVNYGAAGIALALLRLSSLADDPAALAAADVWAERARREIGTPGAFHNAGIQITPEIVGASSLYHSPSGVHLARALVARARADAAGRDAAEADFLAAAALPPAGLDLTLGSSGLLLGMALLLEVRGGASGDSSTLRARGDLELERLWNALDAKPEIERADVDYLGIAHGWAGFLYASLVWCEISGREAPAGVEGRLAELAALAQVDGRGLRWPWVLRAGDGGSTMPGWCNGSCGHLFLWLAAHRRYGRDEHLELARGAAWDSWDAPESGATICCGHAGRAYALLALHRRTGERIWLERARDLAWRAAREETSPDDYPHSLYKGDLGLTLLLADLERPHEARIPLFEPEGETA